MRSCSFLQRYIGRGVGGGPSQIPTGERHSYLLAHVTSLRTSGVGLVASELLRPTEPKCLRAALGLYINPTKKKRQPLPHLPDGNVVSNHHKVCLVKVANAFKASRGSVCVCHCGTAFVHKLRPMMMMSLGKPSILATSKHPSLL